MIDPVGWLAERAGAYHYEVTPVPLSQLARWQLGDELVHDTRRFFGVVPFVQTGKPTAFQHWID